MADQNEEKCQFVETMRAEVNATPLDEMLFMELIELSTAALAGKLRTIPPDEERCLEDAPPGSFMLTDVPENQMAFAIFDRCRGKFGNENGTRMAKSFLHRWFAIMKAKHDGVLDEFTRPGDEGMIEIHPAVFLAGAGLPLNSELDFERGEYFQKIREIIRSVTE